MENNDTPELTGRQRGIINAIAANRRNREERLARELEERGWIVHSPYSEDFAHHICRLQDDPVMGGEGPHELPSRKRERLGGMVTSA